MNSVKMLTIATVLGSSLTSFVDVGAMEMAGLGNADGKESVEVLNSREEDAHALFALDIECASEDHCMRIKKLIQNMGFGHMAGGIFKSDGPWKLAVQYRSFDELDTILGFVSAVSNVEHHLFDQLGTK